LWADPAWRLDCSLTPSTVRCHEPRLKKMCVRHQPNLASGGKSSVIDVSAFLSEGHGPQHEALLQLLAKPNPQ
jgi:hypothetical protein